MTATHVVTLSADTSRLQAALLALTEAAEARPELSDAILSFLEFGEQIVSSNSHRPPAAPAGELLVRFDPGDGLFGLMTAAGAIDRYRALVENAGHNSPSNAVGSGEHSIAGAEAGVMPVSDAEGAAA